MPAMRDFFQRRGKFRPEQADEERADLQIPEDLWIKCPSCGELIYSRELERSAQVCPKCSLPSPAARPRANRSAERSSAHSSSCTPTSGRKIHSALSMAPVRTTRSWSRPKTSLASRRRLSSVRPRSAACRRRWPSATSSSWAPAWVRSTARSWFALSNRPPTAGRRCSPSPRPAAPACMRVCSRSCRWRRPSPRWRGWDGRACRTSRCSRTPATAA